MNKKERDELYEIARKALVEKDDQKAIEIYQRIRDQYPVEWEAFFFTLYLNVYVCPDDELINAATALYKSEKDVLNLIDTYVKDLDKHIDAIIKVGNYLEEVALDLRDTAFDIFEKSNKDECDIIDLINYNIIAKNIISMYINTILKRYSGDFGLIIFENAQHSLESSMDIMSRILPFLKGDIKAEFEEELNDLIEIGRRYNLRWPSTISYPDEQKAKKGCYIATSVYGSYDCPEVWVLRRFRDYYLAKSLWGRTFIKVYYQVSPLIVVWFGGLIWFKQICKNVLDMIIQRLQDAGYETTPYDDL